MCSKARLEVSAGRCMTLIMEERKRCSQSDGWLRCALTVDAVIVLLCFDTGSEWLSAVNWSVECLQMLQTFVCQETIPGQVLK